jgi:hypothetical protein
MLLTLLLSILGFLVSAIVYILPTYETYPFPEGFLDALTTIFGYSNTLIDLPFIRVYADFISN